jgi:hypothetical protein
MVPSPLEPPTLRWPLDLPGLVTIFLDTLLPSRLPRLEESPPSLRHRRHLRMPTSYLARHGLGPIAGTLRVHVVQKHVQKHVFGLLGGPKSRILTPARVKNDPGSGFGTPWPGERTLVRVPLPLVLSSEPKCPISFLEYQKSATEVFF